VVKHSLASSHLRLGVLAALLALPLGCAKREPAPGEATRPSVRFAYQDRVADAASMIAVEKGFFRDEGLDVKPLVFSSGPACSEALFSGSADIGTMGDTTAIIAVARSPVKIIASHGGGEHRHRIIVGERSGIRAPADLAGKRVAVKKGTSTYGGLLAWSDSVGLDLAKVKVTEMRPEDMGDALMSGAVDAIVASEPTPSVVEQRGGRELATLGGLGNTYPILLVARNEFLAVQPEAVESCLKAMRRAADFIQDHPEEAAELLAGKTGLSPAVTARAMSHHYYRVDLGEDTRASLRAIADFLVKQRLLDSHPDLTKTVDASFLEARPAH
jgi:sulfonate transport system substrate-binding protein